MNVLEICLKSDALNVPGEDDVVTSLLRWIRHDLPRREKLLPSLLSLTRLHHLPSLEVQSRNAGFCDAMQLCLIFPSVSLCVQTLSWRRARPVGRWSRRLSIARIGTEACTRTPGRPPRGPTFTSTKRKRTERSGTLSATVRKPTSGEMWEQIAWRRRSCFQTHQDAVLLAMQKRYKSGFACKQFLF